LDGILFDYYSGILFRYYLQGIDNLEQYYVLDDVSTGSTIFEEATGEFSLCLSKIGYIPYVTNCGNEAYWQNFALTGNHDVTAHKLFVGTNVTNQVNSGMVTIQNGETYIRNKGSVTIEGEFEVCSGASFEIIPDL